jgi:hypothetical protein
VVLFCFLKKKKKSTNTCVGEATCAFLKEDRFHFRFLIAWREESVRMSSAPIAERNQGLYLSVSFAFIMR